jgi:hypothetical protein
MSRHRSRRKVVINTGLVSERLWRLVAEGHDGRSPIAARWLGDLPDPVWSIVRDAVLRCA